ncbi:gluconokinase [Sphingomonas sp. PAMC 26621]|uniref:gluconokinase n=1 Tax=Sphingomonas sp. PAMC 26621 TaxID=1112213 RepID=UPI0005617ECB
MTLQRVSATSTIAPMAVIIMGVSGSGKSTLGAMLAPMLHASFVEGDSFHDAAAVAKMRSGHPLDDADRWPWLDRLGTAIGVRVRRDGVAVAACSALRRVYRERLSTAIGQPTRFILLDDSRAELQRRMAARAGHYMPPSLLDSQIATLERPAPDEAATILDASAPAEDLSAEAVEWLTREAARLRATQA